MSWMDRISHTERGEHPMLNTSDGTSRNALTVMENAGALFQVNYPPATWSDGWHGENYRDCPVIERGVNQGLPLYKWVVRVDSGEPLGLHSGTYAQTDSYRYVGEMAERLFPNSTESCTLFGKGERMALAQNIGDPIDLGDGDIIKPQVLWVSSFNGQWSTSVFHLTQRWFCMNQLAGNRPIFSVKHTKHHDFTFEQRSGILQEAMAHAEILGRMARTMKDQDYTNYQFNELVKKVVPLPRAFNDEGDIHAAAERRMKKNRDSMDEAWKVECVEFGNTWKQEEREFFDGNKWLAYNAVQGAEQHNINARFNTTEVGTQRAMTKMVNGVTPYAKRALDLLTV